MRRAVAAVYAALLVCAAAAHGEMGDVPYLHARCSRTGGSMGRGAAVAEAGAVDDRNEPFRCVADLTHMDPPVQLTWVWDGTRAIHIGVTTPTVDRWICVAWAEVAGEMAPATAVCVADGEAQLYDITSMTAAGVNRAPRQATMDKLKLRSFNSQQRDGATTLSIHIVDDRLPADPAAAYPLNFARGTTPALAFHGDDYQSVRVRYGYAANLDVPSSAPGTRPHYTPKPAPALPTGRGQCSVTGSWLGDASMRRGAAPLGDITPVRYCNLHFHIPGAHLHWVWNGVASTISWSLESASEGWLAFAFPEEAGEMAPALAIIMTSPTEVAAYRIVDTTPGGIIRDDEAVRTELGVLSLDAFSKDGKVGFAVTMNSQRFRYEPAINIARNLETWDIGVPHAGDQRVAMRLNFNSAQEWFVNDVHTHRCDASDEVFVTIDGDGERHEAPFLCQYALPVMTDATFHYNYSRSSPDLHVKVVSASHGWLGVGFATRRNAMHPALAVVFDGETVDGFNITAEAIDQVVQDDAVLDVLDVRDVVHTREGGTTVLQFRMNYRGLPGFAEGMTRINVTVARDLENRAMGRPHGREHRVAFVLNVEEPHPTEEPYTPFPQAATAVPWTAVTRPPPVRVPPRPDLPRATAPPRGICKPSEFAEYHCRLAGPENKFVLHWTYDPVASTISMAVKVPRRTWVGVAFPDEYGEMAPAKGIIYDDSGLSFYDFVSESIDGVLDDWSVQTQLGVSWGARGEYVDGGTVVMFKRRVPVDFMAQTALNVAWGGANEFHRGRHAMGDRAALEIQLESGIIHEHIHDRHLARRAHAVCMVVAFLLLIPLAAAMKRYPEKAPCCGYPPNAPQGFTWHVGLNIVAIVTIALGYLIAKANFDGSDAEDKDDHEAMGTLLFIVAVFAQPALGATAAYCLPRTHANNATLRVFHRLCGVVIMGLAAFCILSGLSLLKELDSSPFPWFLGWVAVMLAAPVYLMLVYVTCYGSQQWLRGAPPPPAQEEEESGEEMAGRARGDTRTTQNSIPVGFRQDIEVSREAY